MSNPLQFRIDSSLQDADDAADEVGSRTDLRDFPDAASSDCDSDSHTDSEGEGNEPDDVRSFSHSYVLQAALQKNQSDPHFNPAHSKIKQPASILQDPPVSCLVGIGPPLAVAEDCSSEQGSVSGPTERVLVAALRSEQQRYEEAPGVLPSLSDENITAGRWIGHAVELRTKYLLETSCPRYSRIQELRRTQDVPTLKPASKREPTPFDEVEVPTDKLDVIAKMVDGVFQVLPAQQFLRVDSSDSIDKEPSLFVETGGNDYQPPTQPNTPHILKLKREGAALASSSSVGSLTRTSSTSTLDAADIVVAVSLAEFVKDLRTLMRTLESGPVNSLCNDRMKMLEAKFELYHLQMKEVEDQRLKSVPHRDFFNVRKVDTHVHHSSCMTQRALLDFIKQKLLQDDRKNAQDRDIVHVEPKPKDGQPSHMTLTQVFQSLSLSAYDLSRDTLDMHADRTLWHRFDKFNLKYNPFGKSMLRQIFLKTDNVMSGRFLAEITRGVFKDLEDSKYQLAEYRISIYGKDASEWDNLATWVVNHRLLSPNVRWLIQIPRIFSTLSRAGSLQNFEQMLSNIFKPLFETTIDPCSHPCLHKFLQHVVGFDSVDDESLPEWKLHNTPKSAIPKPLFFKEGDNPPYNYYLYYMWANISVLNRLRMSVPRRGYREFSFRPHAGEAGLVDHLAGAFLLSDGLSHGIVAKSSPSMQMLLYLSQIGLAMSPMSNNSLFVHYNDNPFDTFFRRGLNLSLSTDDPLQFHYTTQPLIEEYGVASTVWHYSSADMCEIARNSVLQSGFEDGLKSHWLGPKFGHGASGNDMNKSNVPDERLRFRERNLKEERDFFSRCKKLHDDAKMARRASAPQVSIPQTPQIRQSSPVESFASLASLARSKSVSHQASGKMSPSLTCASPKKSSSPSAAHSDTSTFSSIGRSRTLAPPPHEHLRAQIDEWNRKLQSLEAGGGSMQEKEKEEAVGEVARALEKLMQVYGHDA